MFVLDPAPPAAKESRLPTPYGVHCTGYQLAGNLAQLPRCAGGALLYLTEAEYLHQRQNGICWHCPRCGAVASYDAGHFVSFWGLTVAVEVRTA